MDPREEYLQTGWCKIEEVIPQIFCEGILEPFIRFVKPKRQPMYRQSGQLETSRYSVAGHMLNGLLNPHLIQSRPGDDAVGFVAACRTLLYHPKLLEILTRVMGSPCDSLQSMFFDASPGTAPHQDYVYLDTDPTGGLVGVWIALEDIDPRAGSFFLVSKEDTPELPTFTWEDIFKTGEYPRRMTAEFPPDTLKIHTPMMRQGDIILWDTHVLHGTLRGDPSLSRRSIAAHYAIKGQKVVFPGAEKKPSGLAIV